MKRLAVLCMSYFVCMYVCAGVGVYVCNTLLYVNHYVPFNKLVTWVGLVKTEIVLCGSHRSRIAFF